MFQSLIDDVHLCFVKNERWHYLWNGLGVTLEVALTAIALGLVIGFFIAIIRSSHDEYGRFSVLNALAKVYLTIIRGTPMVVQLLICYFIIMKSLDKVAVAILAFGINSGAYQAEILRAGIMSIDQGQMEAGRSLGFGYVSTMRYIILPQAFKTVLPTLANEFIVLLKETAVAGYVGLADVTYAGNIVGGNTYDYLFPLLMSALIYLVLVMFFTYLVGKLERRLRNSER